MIGCLNCIYSYYKHYYNEEDDVNEGSYYCDQHEIAVGEDDHCCDYIERGVIDE